MEVCSWENPRTEWRNCTSQWFVAGFHLFAGGFYTRRVAHKGNGELLWIRVVPGRMGSVVGCPTRPVEWLENHEFPQCGSNNAINHPRLGMVYATYFW